ncbi:SPOR domain-containing protein [Jannaschia seohaensis]
MVERDVEAPEVFQTTDLALWDGRPSLGGVWVASPDVREPERVIIRNQETGEFVVGALFKRERLGPGPRLQLSSDAAAALGALAGAPVMLEVVALRREEAPEPAPVFSEPEAVAEAEAETSDVETEIAAAPPPEPENAAAEGAPIEAAEEELPPGTERVDVALIAARAMAARRAAEEAARAAEEAAAAEAAAAEEAAAEGAAIPEISATSLDAPDVEAAALSEQAVIAPTQPRFGLAAFFSRRDEISTPEPLPAAATVAAGGPTAVSFVQVGLFSQESNARAATRQLADEGIMSSIVPNGTSWRVLIGPTPEADRAAILRKARELGYEDAYPVTG